MDRKQLKEELRRLGRDAAVAVAARAALRAAPRLSKRAVHESAFKYWGDKRRHRLIGVHRALLTSAVAVGDATAEVRRATSAAADAAATSAAFADAAAFFAADASATSAAFAADASATSAAFAADAAADASATSAAFAAADAATSAAFATAVGTDLTFWRAGAGRPGLLSSLWRAAAPVSAERAIALLSEPLWNGAEPPAEIASREPVFQQDLLALDAGFEVWVDWRRARLAGAPWDADLMRRWALSPDEVWEGDPAEANRYFAKILGKTLVVRGHNPVSAPKEAAPEADLAPASGPQLTAMKRVRVIFLGPGYAGKTSVIRTLHGEPVVEGREPMTPGVAIRESVHKDGAVDRADPPTGDVKVHYWDFGGQVMLHATHQFFLRSNCVYVLVLDGRAETRADEEAEYWLNQVDAHAAGAPVLIVGNKADRAAYNLDMGGLQRKFSNVVGFFPFSATGATAKHRPEFEIFQRALATEIAAETARSFLFDAAEEAVVDAVRDHAKANALLSPADFSAICDRADLPEDQRQSYLTQLDRLGVVIHFPKLDRLNQYILNPRWLTNGVYSVLCSDQAKDKGGRITLGDVRAVLAAAPAKDEEGGRLGYEGKADLVFDAMCGFEIAYPLPEVRDVIVLPALLPATRPEAAPDWVDGIQFRFRFTGFLPRHLISTLIVRHHGAIARTAAGEELVWQNGAVFQSAGGFEAEAMAEAAYGERVLTIAARGPDANAYLRHLSQTVRATLDKLDRLEAHEELLLTPAMREPPGDPLDGLRSAPDWGDYDTVIGAQRDGEPTVRFGRHLYSVARCLTGTPNPAALRHQPVFLSYSRKDSALAEALAADLRARGIGVWIDNKLRGEPDFDAVLRAAIDGATVVLALWSPNAVQSQWVKGEASRAGEKLMSLRTGDLDPSSLPIPIGQDDMIEVERRAEIVEALAGRGVAGVAWGGGGA